MATALPSAPQPLFDRLLGPGAAHEDAAALDAAVGLGRLDARGLQASLAAELGQLLNTRSRLGPDRYLAQARRGGLTLLDYGLPDLTTLNARSATDRARLAELVQHCLARFEPRLSHTEVQALPIEGDPHRVRLFIDAAVRLGRELRRVQFDLAADARQIASRTAEGGR